MTLAAAAELFGPSEESVGEVFADPASETPTISASRITTWQRCQRLYYHRYIRRERPPASGAMVRGSAIGETLEAAYLEKLERGAAPSPDEAAEAFAESFTRRSEAEEVDWQERHSEPGAGALREQGIAIVREHVRTRAPHIRPAGPPQRRIDVAVPGAALRYIGYVDLDAYKPIRIAPDGPELEARVILDFKNGASRRTDSQLRADVQMAGYLFADDLGEGERPAAVSWEVGYASKGGRSVECYPVDARRGELQLQDFWTLVRATQAQVATTAEQDPGDGSAFVQTGVGTWACSQKHCAFFGRCFPGSA